LTPVAARSDDGWVRLRLVVPVVALVVAAALSVGTPEAAAAGLQHGDGNGGGSGTTDDTPVPAQDIIPEPNSGRAPDDAGDRGGVLQGVVLLFILVGVGGVVALTVRESRRNRSRSAEG
jgi:hypothetical protein